MIKIKIIATKEIREVTSNVAHDLIDRGIATVAKAPKKKRIVPTPTYSNRSLSSKSRSPRIFRSKR